MKSKKEYLNLNTIIIVVIVLAGLTALLGVFTGRLGKIAEPIHEKVCANLERENEDKSISVYPEIINTRNEIESGWNMVIPSIFGKSTRVRSWDDDGVTCEILAESCIANTYCIDIKMLISVNYTQYFEWYNK